ncbi:hypothetical protein DPMN_038054 [Dreissena polymorpha]|uniref:Uncharacterized protein n=1 Tax=Dreissena polymorpha TaxID=45954 RepID=A0A9D4RMV0_DREPO|nr:hypothetical protein DPMN_038054 [Dreissena polymorpha]
MELLVHNLLRLAIAAVAMLIFFRTVAIRVPSLDMDSPINIKLFNNSTFSPFMLVSALVLIVLITKIFDFALLTSFQYAPALSECLLVRF